MLTIETMLWMSDDIYTNIDILKGWKECCNLNLDYFFNLHKTITIDDETYEDFDEVWTYEPHKILFPTKRLAKLVKI
jgi:hypothetical protein